MEPIETVENLSHQPAPLQEKQLVRQVREHGDRSAFEKIFRLYYKKLHGFAYTYVKNKEIAEDIIQTIFLRIWENRQNWDPPGKVKHYLFNAVRNESLNSIRHERIAADSQDDVIDLFKELNSRSYHEKSTELEELRSAIHYEIEQLPSCCREIYLLNRRSGLTYVEIAEYLDVSVNTVSTQMGRALKKLRKNLSDYFPVFIISVLSKLLL